MSLDASLFVFYPTAECLDMDRCRTNPAAAADCWEHRWDSNLSPLVEEPAYSYTQNERYDFAQDPRTPVATLREIYTVDPVDTASVLACNPATPADLLGRIRTYSHNLARLALLANPVTPMAEVHAALAELGGPAAEAAANNRALTGDRLEWALRRGTDPLRHYVLGNPATPRDLLREFSYDCDERSRTAVAGNPSTPDDIRIELASDAAASVRFCAGVELRDLPTLTSIVHERQTETRLGAAFNPRLSELLLWELLHDNGEDIDPLVLAVAEHRNVTEDLLVSALRAVEAWDDQEPSDYEEIETYCTDQDAVEDRVITWIRRSRSIAWDDVRALRELSESELAL